MMKPAIWVLVLASLASWAACGADTLVAQPSNAVNAPSQLDVRGYVNVPGRKVPYLIRHLPVSSFPELPVAMQTELNRRGCLIPQTYEAHRPENVVRGSFEKAGSADWAVLCSAEGAVTLLVFFASDPANPAVVASSREAERLQPHDLTGVMGFNWAIDVETPAQIHEAQIGMEPRPRKLDHDAVGDSVVEHKVVYRYYAGGAWVVIQTE